MGNLNMKFDSGFQNMDTSVYKIPREGYLPPKIKYLIVAESPPAFIGEKPKAYFYFPDVPKADSLFYSLVNALLDFKFEKYIHNRIQVLNKFKENGFYLVDIVDYPINKDRSNIDIDNFTRNLLIRKNRKQFENHLKTLIDRGHMDNDTKALLIKETVYSEYSKHPLLNVINKNYIGFPSYVNDRGFAEKVRDCLRH